MQRLAFQEQPTLYFYFCLSQRVCFTEPYEIISTSAVTLISVYVIRSSCPPLKITLYFAFVWLTCSTSYFIHRRLKTRRRSASARTAMTVRPRLTRSLSGRRCWRAGRTLRCWMRRISTTTHLPWKMLAVGRRSLRRTQKKMFPRHHSKNGWMSWVCAPTLARPVRLSERDCLPTHVRWTVLEGPLRIPSYIVCRLMCLLHR